MPKEEPKAKREFDDIADVTRYFEKNPNRLVDYVEMGIARRTSVLAVHIAQLAYKVGIPPVSGKTMFTALPETYIKPERFTNIGDILTEAYKRFPPSLISIAA